jgi:DNA-directed RNA polymerase sigma subunit (sigma70/sigma32)
MREYKYDNSHEDNRYNNMTQQEVAEVMGLTRSQIDTLEKLALRKLRIILSQKNYYKSDLF